jgi:hypothetical protein
MITIANPIDAIEGSMVTIDDPMDIIDSPINTIDRPMYVIDSPTITISHAMIAIDNRFSRCFPAIRPLKGIAEHRLERNNNPQPGFPTNGKSGITV